MSISAEQFFSALANETRLRCLALLVSEDELCVCELTHALGLSQPMISRHLAFLRDNHIVQDRRAGLWIYYRLHPELPDWAKDVLQQTMQGIRQEHPYAEDLAKLHDMPNRPGARCCA